MTPATIEQRFIAMQIFVAVTPTGQIVGTIACSGAVGGEGHLRGMAVGSAHQGRSLAERLLRVAEETLLGNGCARITLDTTAPLERAIRFYEKNGYFRSGRVTDFFGMPLYEYVKLLPHQ